MKNNIFKNAEGYADPTAGTAIKTTIKEEKSLKADERRVDHLVRTLKYIIGLENMELLNRIQLKDKSTGKEYK